MQNNGVEQWAISYDASHMRVTCYGSKNAIEDLGKHLDSVGMKYEIAPPKEEKDSSE